MILWIWRQWSSKWWSWPAKTVQRLPYFVQKGVESLVTRLIYLAIATDFHDDAKYLLLTSSCWEVQVSKRVGRFILVRDGLSQALPPWFFQLEKFLCLIRHLGLIYSNFLLTLSLIKDRIRFKSKLDCNTDKSKSVFSCVATSKLNTTHSLSPKKRPLVITAKSTNETIITNKQTQRCKWVTASAIKKHQVLFIFFTGFYDATWSSWSLSESVACKSQVESK